MVIIECKIDLVILNDLQYGTTDVKSKAMPAVTMQPHKICLRPHLFKVNSKKIYAGISTAPETTKFK